MTFPPVGVTALIAGMAVFNRDAAIVENRLRSIQRVAGQMEATSVASGSGAARAFTGMANAVTAAGTVVAGALAFAGAASIKFAADFEQSMALTKALTGATDEQMARLETTIIALTRTGTMGMSDLNDAATELARAGVPIEQVMDGALKAVQDLTIASGEEIGLSAAAKLVATSMNAFGLSIEEVDRITTAATVVAQNSALTFTDFGTAVQYAAPGFQAAGFSIEDLALATALLGKNGVTGSVAATSLRGVIQRLIRPSNDAQKVMDQYGISLFDAEGKARGFDEVLGQLRNAFSDEAVATGKLTEEQRLQAISTLGLQRTGAAFLILANSTVEEIDNLRGSFERLRVTDLVDILLEPLNAQMKIAWNNVTALAYAFGNEFVKAMAGSSRGLVAFLQGIKTVDMANLAKQVIAFGQGLFSAIGEGIQKIRDFAEAFGLTGPAIELAKNAMIGLGAIIVGTILVHVVKLVAALGGFLIIVGLVTTGVFKLIDAFNQSGIVLPSIGDILDGIGKKLDELGAAWAPWAAEAGVAGEIVNQVLIGLHGVVESLQFILQGNFTAAALSANQAMSHLAEAANAVYIAMTPLIEAFGAFAKFLGEHLEIIAGVAAGFLALKAGLAIVGAVTALAGAWAALSGAIATSGGIIAAIVAILGGPVTIIIAAIAIAIGLLTAAWIGNWGDIQGKTAVAVEFLTKAFENFKANLNIAVQRFISDIQTIGEWFNQLGTFAHNAVEAVGRAFSNLGSHIQEIIQSVGQFFDGLGTSIRNALDTIGSTIGNFFSNIGSSIQGALQAIRDIFQRIWNAIPADISADLGIVSALIPQRLGEWLQTITEGMGRILQTIASAWQTVIATVGMAMSTLGTNVNAAWTTITTFISTAMTTIGTVVSTGWTMLSEFTMQAYSLLTSVVIEAWNTIYTAVSGALTSISAAISAAWAEYTALIGAALATILGIVMAWVSTVVGIFTGLVGQLAAAGRAAGEAIIQGLVGAIQAGITAVANAAANVARTALAAAKAALGAQSPSKAFQELGNDVNEGFELGLEETGYDVVQAATDIVADLEFSVVQRLEQAKRPIRGSAAGLVDDLISELSNIQGQMDLLMSDMQAKMTSVAEEVGRKINEAVIDAAEAIAETIADTNERIADMIENIRQSRSDRAARQGLQRDQDARRRARREGQEDEDAKEKRDRDLSDAEFRLKQDLEKAKTDEERAAAEARYQERIADIERSFKLDEEERLERRARQQSDAEFERELEKETQDFNDRLEDEALQRSIARAEHERDERIRTINEALAEKQKQLREQGEREINELRENTMRKIDILQREFSEKAAEILRKGGEQMRPLVDNIQEILTGNFEAMRVAANSFTNTVLAAIDALKKLREAAEAAAFDAPELPDPAEGLGEIPEFQKGGWVPGPRGKPMLAVVHGGEYITGLHTEAAKMLAQMSRSRPNATNTYNLNLNASYSEHESPASVEMDMRALIAMARG